MNRNKIDWIPFIAVNCFTINKGEKKCGKCQTHWIVTLLMSGKITFWESRISFEKETRSLKVVAELSLRFCGRTACAKLMAEIWKIFRITCKPNTKLYFNQFSIHPHQITNPLKASYLPETTFRNKRKWQKSFKQFYEKFPFSNQIPDFWKITFRKKHFRSDIKCSATGYVGK